MPNWTYNYVTIQGSEKDVKNFLKKTTTKGVFDFNKIIPEPKTLKEYLKQGFKRATKEDHIETDKKRPWFNWYDWHNRMWGTKWNACDYDEYGIEKIGDSLTVNIMFNTAWDAPRGIINKVMKKMSKNLHIFWTAEYEDWTDGKDVFYGKNNKLIGEEHYERNEDGEFDD